MAMDGAFESLGAVSKYTDKMIGGSYVTDKYRERVLSAVGQANR